MSNDPEIQAGEHAPERGTSLNRRRLLKAAAASAPLIATLPSGAAMANASTSQCVKDSYDATHGVETLGTRTLTQGPDQYLRETIPVGFATKSGAPTVSPLYQIDGKLYFPDGTEFTDDTYTFVPRSQVLAIRVFVPYDDASNSIDPEQPTDVETAIPGIWPANQLSDDSHMGLTGSCLCSINPDLA